MIQNDSKGTECSKRSSSKHSVQEQWLHYLDEAERGSFQQWPQDSRGGRKSKTFERLLLQVPQQDLVGAHHEFSVQTITHTLNIEELNRLQNAYRY